MNTVLASSNPFHSITMVVVEGHAHDCQEQPSLRSENDYYNRNNLYVPTAAFVESSPL